MKEKKNIFILVKTYPTISKEYAELVCTAGILENGTWIRLYPVPFRRLDIEKKYPKYSWIEVEVTRNKKDFRPETYRPILDTLALKEKPNKIDWDERNKIIFEKQKTYTNLQELIEKAKKEKLSLALFKPTKIIDFIAEETEKDWPSDKLTVLKLLSQQQNLFQTPEQIEEEFKIVKKLPYKFSYRFEDDSGKQSTMMIEDWEIGALFFNCLKQANGNEIVAKEKVRKKYFDYFLTRDLYFFLGTTLKYHNFAQNPFIIIGVYYPPKPKQSKNKQLNLFEKENDYK